MTAHGECIYERCERPRSDRISEPLCAHHARRVYLAVKDLVEAADWVQASQSARPPREGSRPRNYRGEVGSVYFAKCGDLIKIGFSTNVRQRMRALGADELLASVPGTREDEKALHAKFGRAWDHGEYFRRTPALLAYIEGIA